VTRRKRTRNATEVNKRVLTRSLDKSMTIRSPQA
jgi:hypothetical protein